MVQQLDGKEVKRKIFDFLENHGPSLPVQISKYMQMNTLFIGAFLSEMASDKTLIISDMKVGGSPLYYTISKKQMLENFVKFLNSKEKEAQALLKEKLILQDSQQHPAIRVALRGLKDFATGFRYNDSIFWRYFTLSENEAIQKINEALNPKKIEEKIPEPVEQKTETQPIVPANNQSAEMEIMKKELLEKQKELEKMREQLKENSQDKINEKKEKIEKPIEKKEKPTKKQKRINEKEEFLNEIKDYCIKKGLDIKNIESFDKKQVFAIIISEGKEYLLGAFDKRKTEESDIMKTYKKSLAYNIPYLVISKGEAPKRAKETIDAYKRLASLEKLEEAEEQTTLQ